MNSNSPQPLVSIGIPTYNRANGKLLNVIHRALEQTYQNVEVIVSDNCSSDNTTEVVLSVKDDRLKYVRHETNIGANNNFNHCLKEANGEYFLLFHDDDMIDIDFVESCMSSVEDNKPVGAIFTGIRIIDEDDKILRENKNTTAGLTPVEFVLGWFDSKIALYLPSTLYNTKLLREVGGFSSKKNLYPDLAPTFKLVAKYDRSNVADVKASFRRHTGSLGSSVPIKDWIDDSLYILEVLSSLFPDDRDILQEKGKLYFCKKMYWYTSRRPKSLQRYADYLRIYKAFDYCYLPVEYFNSGKIDRLPGKIKRLFKRN